MKIPHYTVPALTLGELATVRFSVKETLCRWWPWRKDAFWRANIRECIAALRKLKQQEGA